MKKIVIIEDDIKVVADVSENIKGSELDWFYVSKNSENAKTKLTPKKKINNKEGLSTIFDDYFQEDDDCLLLLDISLSGIIKDSSDFLKSEDFIQSILSITKCRRYLVAIISTYRPTKVMHELKRRGLENICDAESFKDDFDVTSLIEEMNNVYERKLEYYFKSISLSCDDMHHLIEEEKNIALNKLAKLLYYDKINELYGEVEIDKEIGDENFIEFLKVFGCKEIDNLSLMGCLFIAWRIIRKAQYTVANKKFSIAIKEALSLNNSDHFIRYSRIFASNNNYQTTISNIETLEKFFELIFINDEERRTCNLSKIIVEGSYVEYYIDINYDGFIERVRDELKNINFLEKSKTIGHQTSRTFIEVFKSVVYSDNMIQLNGIMLFRSADNQLILKFIA